MRVRACCLKMVATIPDSQTPWQEIFREKVGRLDEGMILKDADKYQDIARQFMPRDNH